MDKPRVVIADMDEGGLTWDREGVLASVNHLLKEHNTLFDDMEKKVSQIGRAHV